MIDLVRGRVRVILEDCGEGWCGYYGEIEDDTPLLRFTVMEDVADPEELYNEWVQVDDASYCTRIPVDTPEITQRALAEMIMNEVEGPVREGYSVKKLCERLSWIGVDWLGENPVVSKVSLWEFPLGNSAKNSA